MRRLISLFCLLCAGVTGALAQPRSAEVFGLAGIGRIAEDEGSLGTGPAVAGAVQAPFTRRLALDLDVAWTSASRSFGGQPEFTTKQILVSPSLVYRWGSEKAYFFTGGGIGYDSTEIRESFDDSGATLNAKAGVVARIKDGLLFRADVVSAWRFVLPHVQVRAGVGYRF